jgi:hypothetical protein
MRQINRLEHAFSNLQGKDRTMADNTEDTAVHLSNTKLHLVTIKLSPQQRADLEKLTGEKLHELRLGVEDLLDLGDLVAN